MSAGEGDGSISGSAGPSGAASTETACSSVAQQQPDSSSSSTTTTSSSPSSTDSGTTSAATTTPATTTTGSGSGGGAGSAASSQPTPTATTTTTTTTTTITTATTASGGGAVSARESGAGAGAGTGAGAGGGGGGVVVMSEVVKEFRAATRADEHQAIEYIEMSNGNLLAALAKFFDDETQKLLGGRKTPMRQEDPYHTYTAISTPFQYLVASTGARPAPPLLPPSSQLVELPLDEIPKQPLTPKADQPTPKAEQLTPKEEHRTPKERETEPPTEQEPAHLEVAEKISVTLGECVLPAYSSTVGAEFMLVQPNTQGLQSFKIQFWDTAGIEKYRSLASTYYRSSSAVIVVYSCTDRVSFDHASKWLIEAKEHLRDAIIVLVGSKIDLVSERKVSTLEGEALATAFSIPFHEVSASSGENVPRFLKEIIQCIYLKGYSSNFVVVGDSQAGKSALTLRIKTCTVDVSVLAACLQTEAGGLGNSPLPRVQKTLFPAVVVIPRLPMLNPIDKLASLQLTDGSWILSDELAAVIGQSIRILDDNTPQSPPSLAIIKHAWPTCLVLAYLEKEHSHHKSDWQSLSLRANRWIDRTVPANNVDKITNAARTMLGSRD
ncbi:rab protein 6 [Pelomyxa schiedti]|nr:rab protein 6 [Pelomyxa schiedti]